MAPPQRLAVLLLIFALSEILIVPQPIRMAPPSKLEEYALLVIQSDGSAAAIAGDFAAGELAAEHIQRAGIKVNAGTAPDTLRRTLKGAATLTVA